MGLASRGRSPHLRGGGVPINICNYIFYPKEYLIWLTIHYDRGLAMRGGFVVVVPDWGWCRGYPLHRWIN